MAGVNVINYKYKDDGARRDDYRPEIVGEIFEQGGKKEAQTEQYALFNQDPDAYSFLYGFEQEVAADENFKIAKSEIKYDEQHKKLALLMRLSHPSDLSFKFEDGKITLPEHMSPEQIKTLARLLWFHNISGIELPESNTEEFNQGFEAAASVIEAENESKPKTITAVEPVAMPEEKKEEKHPDIKKIDEQLKRYTKRLGKDKRSYKRTKGSREIIYRIYPDPNAKDKDGKCEKGVTAHTYTIEIKARIDKNGVLNVSWKTPNAKELTAGQADEVVDMLKNAGYTHMQFGPDMTDDDKKAFREACARKGIVPIGIYPNEFHVRKMIAQATDNLPEEALIKYKEALAKQLRENIAEQGQKFEDNRLEKTIKNLEGAVKYDRFNTFASKKLLPQMMRINTSKDAVKIIAACQVYNAMLIEYGEEDNKLKGLSSDELLQEFENRLKSQQEEVKAEIDDRYKEAEEETSGGKSINMSDIIGTMTSNAKADLEFTMSDIKGDCGIEIQRIPITKGKFSYKDLQDYRQGQEEQKLRFLQNARARQQQRA